MTVKEYGYVAKHNKILKRPFDLREIFPEKGKLAIAIPVSLIVNTLPDNDSIVYIVFESIIDSDLKMNISIEVYEYILRKEYEHILEVRQQ